MFALNAILIVYDNCLVVGLYVFVLDVTYNVCLFVDTLNVCVLVVALNAFLLFVTIQL